MKCHCKDYPGGVAGVPPCLPPAASRRSRRAGVQRRQDPKQYSIVTFHSCTIV